MKTITKFSAMALLLFITTALAAQGPGNRQQNRERIEAQKVAFITEKLELTPAEAQQFWPVYNEFDAKRRELNKDFKKAVDPDNIDIDKMSDKEAEELADQTLLHAQKLLDLRKEYHAKFKSILPPKKLLKLYDTEREFQKMLMDRLRDKKPGGPGGPGGPGNKGKPGGPGHGPRPE